MTPSLLQQLLWKLLSLYTHWNAGPERESQPAWLTPVSASAFLQLCVAFSLSLNLFVSFFPCLSEYYTVTIITTYINIPQLFVFFSVNKLTFFCSPSYQDAVRAHISRQPLYIFEYPTVIGQLTVHAPKNVIIGCVELVWGKVFFTVWTVRLNA